MRGLFALAMFLLASCTPDLAPQPPTRASNAVTAGLPVNSFATAPAPAPTRANSDIARDFLDLSFEMESGRAIPVMTRFNGPVRVRVTGPANSLLVKDLNGLLRRLRNEANIDIAMTQGGTAQITVEAVPQAQLQAAVPRAACFVVPRVSSWSDYLHARRTARIDWTSLVRREQATIFIPADAAPQEVRDCLHEELAQALGPLNDLYRLGDSVFNDDNIHAVLTGFDMLVLRAYYAPELRNGMTRAEVAARLPALLSRLNPPGNQIPARPEPSSNRTWINAMETALSGTITPTRRRASAEQAIALGKSIGWSGVREGFSYYAYGRLQVNANPQAAKQAFDAANAIYSQNKDTQIHSAHIAVQMAAFALAAGDPQQVLTIAERSIPIAQEHENAALLATFMMFKAAALDMVGNAAAAERVRLDSQGWARYGFGSEANVAARMAEVENLRPF